MKNVIIILTYIFAVLYLKIADTNIGGRDGFDTYPLYSLGFIKEQTNKKVIKMVDVSKLKIPQ